MDAAIITTILLYSSFSGYVQLKAAVIMVCSRSPTLRHLYTILYNPFLSISLSGSVNTPLWPIHTTQDTGTEGGTGNGTGSIGNNWSWSLFLSWTSVNLSTSLQNLLVSLPFPVPIPIPGHVHCEYTIRSVGIN